MVLHFVLELTSAAGETSSVNWSDTIADIAYLKPSPTPIPTSIPTPIPTPTTILVPTHTMTPTFSPTVQP